MGEADKDFILNRTGTGPGFTPQEPVALVAKMPVSDSERSALESEVEGKGGVACTAETDTTSPEIQYGTSTQDSLTFLFVIFF